MGLVCIQNSSLLVYSKSQKVSASYCLPFQHSRGKNQPVGGFRPPPACLGLNEIDKDLEQYFSAQLKGMNHSAMINLEPRDKLPKVTLTDELKTSVNKILSIYLLNTDSIPEITDKVYTMGRAVSFKLGVGQREQNGDRKQKPKEGNRRERKLKLETKDLKQGITRISNELHWRKVRRKA